jgi:hypothetical protein
MAVELTVEEKLRQMYELQRLDSQIDEIQILKGELPAEVQDLEDELTGLETRLSRLQTELKESQNDIVRFQGNVKDSEANILRYQSQMDNVKNNREYEALTKELEMQKLEIELNEKKVRSARAETEKRDDLLKATEERIQRKHRELDTKRTELQQIIEKTEAEEQELRRRSATAREKIEERLLRAYDKIRTSYRNGLAVVTVERNSCGGCFNKIPPQLQLEISVSKNIVACEHCGRILVDHGVLGLEREKQYFSSAVEELED